MKKVILSILPALFCFVVKSQTITVGADKSFTASLNDHSTYAWSKSIYQIPSDAMYVSSSGIEFVKSNIKNATVFTKFVFHAKNN